MIFDRVTANIEKSRTRRISGQYNCIPWGLPRLEEESPGLEQGIYSIVSGDTKSGKSQLSDHMFVYQPYDFLKTNPDSGIKLKVFYFTLEMSTETKIAQAISRKLFIDSNRKIRVSPKDLMSKKKSYILSNEILDKIKELRHYFEEFEDMVTFVDEIRNPFGIYKYMKDYAATRGIQHKKSIKINGVDTIVDDYYEPYDPNEYTVVLIDHVSLIGIERQHKSLFEAISDMSSKYCIGLRNKYGFSPVLVQQQGMQKQSLDSIKMDRMYPTVDGLSDNKHTAKDCDIAFGIYSPFKHKVRTYQGYDIMKLRDNSRFLEIMISRQGGASSITPLLFDGAVNYFKELPDSSDTANLDKIYKYLESIRTR